MNIRILWKWILEYFKNDVARNEAMKFLIILNWTTLKIKKETCVKWNGKWYSKYRNRARYMFIIRVFL